MSGETVRVWTSGDEAADVNTPMAGSEALYILQEYPGVCGIDIYANKGIEIAETPSSEEA